MEEGKLVIVFFKPKLKQVLLFHSSSVTYPPPPPTPLHALVFLFPISSQPKLTWSKRFVHKHPDKVLVIVQKIDFIKRESEISITTTPSTSV